MKNKLVSWFFWLIILITLLFGVIIFSLCSGSVGITLTKIWETIIRGKDTTEYSILFDIRLPRIILGFAIGGALSLTGVLLQGMFRNPLVEPYTLGISGGAAIGVCLNIVLGINRKIGILSLPLSGFLSAILIILLIYSLSIKKGVLKIEELLLCGVMISFICSSLIMLIMSACRSEDLHGIIFWVMGSLDEPNWMLIKLTLGMSVFGLIISYLFCFDLNALSLGEDEAIHLGINTERTKRLLFIIASLLVGFSVSVAGIIGFVGLVIPHYIRMIVGRDHRILLISSFLSGAGFLIFCDTLARIIIAPMELPVGVITGVLGGILFVWTLTKKAVS